MKKLDLYIIKRFLGTFFFMLALIMSIAIVFDVSEQLKRFIKYDAPVDQIILKYYVNFVFYFGNLFSSLLIFLSVLLFTGQLAQRSEIVAILAGGISFRRLLRPYFIAATILVGISLYFTHYQLPIANRVRIQFEEEFMNKKYQIKDDNLHREIEKNTLAYFETFSTLNNIGYKFSLEKWNDEGELEYKMLADRAKYNEENDRWEIQGYRVREFKDKGEQIYRGTRLDTTLNMVPEDFGVKLNIASTMGYKELTEFIEEERQKGSNQTVFFEIEKHQRTSYPFASYILTVIAVSMAGRKSRGGIGVHLALGVLIAVVYIFAMKVTTVAATNAGLNPLLAVWLPNIFFSGVAVLAARNAQK
ncbi:MAG: LptF/LptG family permease [Bacteroidota bacterium]